MISYFNILLKKAVSSIPVTVAFNILKFSQVEKNYKLNAAFGSLKIASYKNDLLFLEVCRLITFESMSHDLDFRAFFVVSSVFRSLLFLDVQL